MTWDYFGWIVLASSLCWTAGALIAWKETSRPLAVGITASGILLFFLFIIGLWISLERPPLRTLGETRLWYSFFLPLVGLITYIRWNYRRPVGNRY